MGHYSKEIETYNSVIFAQWGIRVKIGYTRTYDRTGNLFKEGLWIEILLS